MAMRKEYPDLAEEVLNYLCKHKPEWITTECLKKELRGKYSSENKKNYKKISNLIKDEATTFAKDCLQDLNLNSILNKLEEDNLIEKSISSDPVPKIRFRCK